jgi:mono/diheme cytochrome c family protein
VTRRKRSLIAGWAIGLILASGPAVWLVANADPLKPNLDDAALVERGKAVYAQQCGSCHGANLEGQPNWRQPLPNGRLPAPPHDQTGHTWHHSNAQLFSMIKNGLAALVPGYETDMPVYKDILSDADIWAVLSFIESTWPATIRARQQRMNQDAK